MKITLLFFGVALCCATISTAQINAGDIDDFENGTTENWTDGGSSSPPINISTGGPLGAGDNYLSNTSLGGTGEGSKMVMFNEQQWAGNYINENIIAIEFDAKVLMNNLNLRIAFDGAGGRICTTNGLPVTAGGDWNHYSIPIRTSDFTLVSGGTNIAQTLADVSTMRILSNSTAAWQGESIEATLEIDNIEAATKILGLNEIVQANEFTISPNPGSNYLKIGMSNQIEDPFLIEFFDMIGNRTLVQNLISEQTEISVAGLSSGVYLVRVTNGPDSQVKKFVKN